MCIPCAEFRLAITSPHNKSMLLNRRLCFFMGAEYFLGGMFSAGRCHIYTLFLHINIAIHSSCPHYPHSYPHICGAIRPFFAFLHIIHTAARLCITPAHLHNARPLHRNPLAESTLTEGRHNCTSCADTPCSRSRSAPFSTKIIGKTGIFL